MGEVRGQVTRRTQTGFQLDGKGWIAISKFADKAQVIAPAIGDNVIAEVDERNFIYTPIKFYTSAEEQGPTSKNQEAKVLGAYGTATDTQIDVRLQVLRIATEMGKLDGLSVKEVASLANRLETWVTR